MTFEFNNDGLGAAMDLINAGIEVKENKENLERIKNEIKTTKVKLVRDRIGMFAFWTGAVASTAIGIENITILNTKTILCCVLSGICFAGSGLFAYGSVNKKDKLSNLHDEEEEALDKCESLDKAHHDATIKYLNIAGDKYYDLYLSMVESANCSFDGVKK